MYFSNLKTITNILEWTIIIGVLYWLGGLITLDLLVFLTIAWFGLEVIIQIAHRGDS